MKEPHILKKQTLINRPVQEIFDFFCNAENLNKITPPSLHFIITTPLPLIIKRHALIDYKLKLFGIPFKWQTEITKWEPPFMFEDIQTKGPYKLWIHTHRFKEVDGGTLMEDVVQYISPGGVFEFIPHNLFVKKRVKKIFDYREEQLKQIFP